MDTLCQRLWSKVRVGTPDECWPFIGGTNKGYGQIKKKVDDRWIQYGAYRAAYECANGEIPEGMEIDHTCCNPACCNPKHLEVVTRAENMARIRARGRARSGILQGEQHGRARFTRAEVEAIKLDPRSNRELARVYGCDKTQISRIRSGKTYRQDGVAVVHHGALKPP